MKDQVYLDFSSCMLSLQQVCVTNFKLSTSRFERCAVLLRLQAFHVQDVESGICVREKTASMHALNCIYNGEKPIVLRRLICNVYHAFGAMSAWTHFLPMCQFPSATAGLQT